MEINKLKERVAELSKLEEQAKAHLYRIQGSKIEVEGQIAEMEAALEEPDKKKRK